MRFWMSMGDVEFGVRRVGGVRCIAMGVWYGINKARCSIVWEKHAR